MNKGFVLCLLSVTDELMSLHEESGEGSRPYKGNMVEELTLSNRIRVHLAESTRTPLTTH